MGEPVPLTQKAAIYVKQNEPIKIDQVKVAEPGFDELLVKILYSGVCHSDLHAWKGEFPGSLPMKYPLIGGHEGAGVVVKLGSNVKNYKLGERVGVKVRMLRCFKCKVLLILVQMSF